ncbi:MAG: monomethylamine:corrinoid methyltransferase [Hadesarchaea archaeon]|nr:monomethylamine:corrinoid methyltransferase [Hadesarchaea archaeon]
MTLTPAEIYNRAETGPIMDEGQFDKKILPRKLRELARDYDIRYNPAEPVPTDDGLADAVFEAGKRLLLDLGILCTDTGRLIKFSEEEIKEGLRSAPKKITVGQGERTRILTPRISGDKRVPWLVPGPSGMPIAEELAETVATAIAKETLAEGYWGPTIPKFQGTQVKLHSPLEIFASKYEITSSKEGVRKAGKEGLPVVGGMTGLGLPAFMAAMSSGGLTKGDCILTSCVNELKINYDILSKVLYTSRCTDVNLMYDPTPVLGGIAGGPEGTAIVSAAQEIECLLLGATLSGGNAIDIWTGTSSSREAIWASDLFLIGMNRNVEALEYCYHFAAAGPCTEMILYEGAAKTIAAVASGYDFHCGPLALKAGKENYISPLEFRLSMEVAHAVAGIKREDANDLIKQLFVKFEDKIKDPPLGKSFTECMDLKSLEPSKEWQDIYEKVKKELMDIGVPFR